MNKNKILADALVARENDVLLHQINIDNYRAAIRKITESGDESLTPFREQLCNLLDSSILEQKKEQIMLDVIREQLEDMKDEG